MLASTAVHGLQRLFDVYFYTVVTAFIPQRALHTLFVDFENREAAQSGVPPSAGVMIDPFPFRDPIGTVLLRVAPLPRSICVPYTVISAGACASRAGAAVVEMSLCSVLRGVGMQVSLRFTCSCALYVRVTAALSIAKAMKLGKVDSSKKSMALNAQERVHMAKMVLQRADLDTPAAGAGGDGV
jgi:hypothetical protein